MTLNDSFGKILRELREKQGLTQKTLGEHAGLARMYIWKLEKGRQSPTLETIRLLVKALDIKAEDFIRVVFELYEENKSD